MKRIYNNSDTVLDLSRLSNLLENADSLIVQLFTTNSKVYAEYSLEDLDDEYKIIVTYDFIKDIGKGVVNCRYNIGYDDSVYPDGQQNKVGQFTTDFYLDSDIIVPKDLDPTILDGVAWGNIVGPISSQADLIQLLNGKVGKTAYNEQITEIETELDTKADNQVVIDNFNTINNRIDLKANSSDLEALNRKVDDLPTSDIISGLNSKIDNHAANTVIHVTQADKDNWNSKQESGDYATNTDLQQVSEAINNTNYRLNNYYTKEQTDSKINVAIENVNGNIERVETKLDNNFVTKNELQSDFITKETASNTYQTKGEYTTVNYVNNNFQRKTEPVIIEQTETTVEIQPNVLNVWGEVEELEISFAEADPTKYNEYMIQFYSGAIATTLTLPSSVQWLIEPSINSYTTYQISIVNNLGIMEGWKNE